MQDLTPKISETSTQPIRIMGLQAFVANGAIITGKQLTEMPVIDWSGSSPSKYDGSNILFGTDSDDNWVTDFLGTKVRNKDLAKATGLKVTLRREGMKH